MPVTSGIIRSERITSKRSPAAARSRASRPFVRVLERATFDVRRFDAERNGRHAAPEVTPECAGNDRVFRREDAADGNAFGDVGISHRRDELDDVRLARQEL
jgi:hypothetical protein